MYYSNSATSALLLLATLTAVNAMTTLGPSALFQDPKFHDLGDRCRSNGNRRRHTCTVNVSSFGHGFSFSSAWRMRPLDDPPQSPRPGRMPVQRALNVPHVLHQYSWGWSHALSKGLKLEQTLRGLRNRASYLVTFYAKAQGYACWRWNWRRSRWSFIPNWKLPTANVRFGNATKQIKAGRRWTKSSILITGSSGAWSPKSVTQLSLDGTTVEGTNQWGGKCEVVVTWFEIEVNG